MRQFYRAILLVSEQDYVKNNTVRGSALLFPPSIATVRVCDRLSTRLIYTCSLEKLQTSYGATSITSPFKSRNKKTQLFLKIIGHTFFFFIEKIIQAATLTLFLMLQSRSQNTIQSTTC